MDHWCVLLGHSRLGLGVSTALGGYDGHRRAVKFIAPVRLDGRPDYESHGSDNSRKAFYIEESWSIALTGTGRQ